jgi:ketosteroid isomerase-like protein
MKKILILALVVSASVAIVACHPGAAELSDQDKAAIRKVTDDAVKIATSPNADFGEYVKLYYAEDATVLAANAPAVQGRPALQALFSSFPPLSEYKPEIIDIDGRGDLAYVRGNYTMTMNPTGAPPVTDKGKYIEVWKRQADGSWKVAYDSWSSDLPVPGLLVPTAAEPAGAEIRKLAGLVGRWQISGTFQPDPKQPPTPVTLGLDCQWFAGGQSAVCLYNGMIAGAPFMETSTYTYNPATKTFLIYNVPNVGPAVAGKVTIEPTTWVHVFDAYVEGKPAKERLILTNVSPDGGDWKEDISVAGAAWTVTASGKYVKAK